MPYNAGAQRAGGFVAGVSIGLVPFGSLVANALIAAGVLVEGTPEAREGLAKGQLLGGLIGMVWGAGKSPSAAPAQAPRPVPATAGGGSAPPLVVVPNAMGVLLGVGGVVTIAAAGAEMAVALTTGGGGTPGSGTGRVKIGGKPWTALEPGAKACQSGCEPVARAIERAIGGEIKVITGPGRVLGRVRNSAGELVNPAGDKAMGWNVHHVVLKDGRVYDALTGPNGMAASEYKQLWEFGDVLDFGF